MQGAVINATTSGDTVIVTGTAGKDMSVYGYTIVASTNSNVSFKTGSVALTGAMPLSANGGVARDVGPYPMFKTVAGDNLVISLSAVANVQGHLEYTVSG